MSGKNKKSKTIPILELLQRRRMLLGNLRREGFPSELPPSDHAASTPSVCRAANAPPAASSTDETAAMREALQEETTRRLPPGQAWRAATGALHTVQLTEVDGSHSGGAVHVMALGERVEDIRWQIDRPSSGGVEQLQLRIGFRARRSVDRGAFGGRTFEFWLERLESADIALDGGPLW